MTRHAGRAIAATAASALAVTGLVATATPAAAVGGIEIGAATSVVEAGNGDLDVTSGEFVTVTIRASVPADIALTGAAVAAQVPDTLALAGSESATPPTATLASGDALPPGSALTVEDAAVRVILPDGWVAPEGTVLVVEYTAQARDVAAVVAGATIEVPATLTGSAGEDALEATAASELTVVEPDIGAGVGWNETTGVASPGGHVQMSASLTNAAGSATAHDVTMVSHLPATLFPLDPDGQPAVDGGDVGYAPGLGTWDASTRTIVWVAGTLAADEFWERIYDVRVIDPIPPGADFTTTVEATATSMPGAVPGERTAGSGIEVDRYAATARLSMKPPPGHVIVSADPATATVGDLVTFTVTAGLPFDPLPTDEAVAGFDVTLVDELPTGLEYVSTVSATCDGEECPVPTSLTPDGGTVGWYVGDLPSSYYGRELDIVYTARVVAPPATGQTLTDAVTVRWNTTDRLDQPASAAELDTFDAVGAAVGAEVTVEGVTPPTGVTVSGSVVLGGRERTPVEGVAVTVRRAHGDRAGQRAVTGADGTWTVAGLEPGRYLVVYDTSTFPDRTRAAGPTVRRIVVADDGVGGRTSLTLLAQVSWWCRHHDRAL